MCNGNLGDEGQQRKMSQIPIYPSDVNLQDSSRDLVCYIISWMQTIYLGYHETIQRYMNQKHSATLIPRGSRANTLQVCYQKIQQLSFPQRVSPLVALHLFRAPALKRV